MDYVSGQDKTQICQNLPVALPLNIAYNSSIQLKQVERQGRLMKPRSHYSGRNQTCIVQEPDPAAREATYSRRWQSNFHASLFFFETVEHNIEYGMHLHAGIEIIWSLNNHCALIHNDQFYRLNFGDAAIFAPFELHGGGTLGKSPARFASLHIPIQILKILADSKYTNPFQESKLPPIKVVGGQTGLRLYREMTRTLPTINTAGDQLFYLNSILNRLITSSCTFELQYPGAFYHPAIKHLRTVIHSSFAEQIDFSELAREVELHERYLISLFKTATGLPPHQFQIALRVEYARKMLEENFPLIDIATAAGFADQSHFNRHFKRSYGVPPGLFKKTMRHI